AARTPRAPRCRLGLRLELAADDAARVYDGMDVVVVVAGVRDDVGREVRGHGEVVLRDRRSAGGEGDRLGRLHRRVDDDAAVRLRVTLVDVRDGDHRRRWEPLEDDLELGVRADELPRGI